MGCGDSREVISPTSSSEESEFPTCDPCINEDLKARGWCGYCNVYLCSECVKSHTASHKIAKGKFLPLSRPRPESLTNNVSVKQVIPNSTLEDSEISRDDILLEQKAIRGCVCIDGFIVTIMFQKMKLYNENFECIQQLDLTMLSPNTICARGYNMVVSFDRPVENADTENDSKKKHKNISKFKDIISFSFSPAGFTKAKISKGGGFRTEGECFTVSMCPVYDKKLMLAAGMTVEYHPFRDDLAYQVQILDAKAKVRQILAFNPRGEPCFEGRFFLSATRNFDDIVVSEIKERRVRGINIKTGKTVYEFGSGHPQGVTCDDDDNIYVYNDGALYWIPPMRNKIFYMHQQPGRKSKKAELSKMTVAISFDSDTRIMYVTNSEKSTIETFRIT